MQKSVGAEQNQILGLTEPDKDMSEPKVEPHQELEPQEENKEMKEHILSNQEDILAALTGPNWDIKKRAQEFKKITENNKADQKHLFFKDPKEDEFIIQVDPHL